MVQCADALNKCVLVSICITFFSLWICKEALTYNSFSFFISFFLHFSGILILDRRVSKWSGVHYLVAFGPYLYIFSHFQLFSSCLVVSRDSSGVKAYVMSYHIRYAFATRTQIHLAITWRHSQRTRLFELDACQPRMSIHRGFLSLSLSIVCFFDSFWQMIPAPQYCLRAFI